MRIETSEDWKKTTTQKTSLLIKSNVLWVKVITLSFSFTNTSSIITSNKTTNLMSWISTLNSMIMKDQKNQSDKSMWWESWQQRQHYSTLMLLRTACHKETTYCQIRKTLLCHCLHHTCLIDCYKLYLTLIWFLSFLSL